MSDQPVATISACQRCKLGKRRCDHGAPKCSGCAKANAACIIVDLITSKRYSREYIANLEVKEQELLARLRSDGGPASQGPATTNSAREQIAVTPRGRMSLELGRTASGFVGDVSGVNFLQSILSATEWETQIDQILEEASQRPQIPELDTPANDGPGIEEGFSLLNNYFSRFHIHHSFLLRNEIFATFDKVYSASNASSCSAQDRFRLFMIFAISGVTRYRSGLSTDHPYGYYLSALNYIDQVPLLGGADAIQNLLLIARFGIYYHVGLSLWDISQSCMRQCLESGYHAPPSVILTPLEEQKRRRIFWECYILDRYSSAILGRPFAIADNDISIDLPVTANDEIVQSTQALVLSDIRDATPQNPAELSVFVFCIKLRRISSRIHSEFYLSRRQPTRSGDASPSTIYAAGHTHVRVDQYLEELGCWRLEAPVFANPSSLYERPEWYDFLFEKDKLVLLRGAMHAAPKRRSNMPSPHLMLLALECATKVVELYAEMLERHYITWTRSYFQTIFIAGLSIIYCLSFRPGPKGQLISQTRYWTALDQCSSVLTIFKREMPDARIFAMIFTGMHQHLLSKHRAPASGASLEHSTKSWMGSGQEIYPTGDQPILQTLDMNFANESGQTLHLPDFAWPDADQESLFLSEDIMLSIEAGLGEYAYGFPGDDPFNFNFSDLTS